MVSSGRLAAWRAFRTYRLLLIAGQILSLLIVLRHAQHPLIGILAFAALFATLRRIGRRRWPW